MNLVNHYTYPAHIQYRNDNRQPVNEVIKTEFVSDLQRKYRSFYTNSY